jgi:hypothetical protein
MLRTIGENCLSLMAKVDCLIVRRDLFDYQSRAAPQARLMQNDPPKISRIASLIF